LGCASSEVQNVIRSLKSGNVYQPGLSQIEYIPLSGKYPESLTREMNTLLLALQNGEIKTNVPFEKP
jgi:hypothetical protein